MKEYELTGNLNLKIEFPEKSELATLNIMEDLQDASKKLEQLSQVKSSILNVPSHELRTPMSPIKGYI